MAFLFYFDFIETAWVILSNDTSSQWAHSDWNFKGAKPAVKVNHRLRSCSLGVYRIQCFFELGANVIKLFASFWVSRLHRYLCKLLLSIIRPLIQRIVLFNTLITLSNTLTCIFGRWCTAWPFWQNADQGKWHVSIKSQQIQGGAFLAFSSIWSWCKLLISLCDHSLVESREHHRSSPR